MASMGQRLKKKVKRNACLFKIQMCTFTVLVEQKRPSLHPIHLANYEELQRTMQAGKKSIASWLFAFVFI
jgi:hypothetical protein